MKKINQKILMCIVAITGLIFSVVMLKANNDMKLLFAVIGGLLIVMLEIAVGGITEKYFKNKYPEEAEESEIEENDERNTTIREKASAKTNLMMIYVNSFVCFTLIMMDAPLYITALVAGALFMQGIFSAYYYNYFEKTM